MEQTGKKLTPTGLETNTKSISTNKTRPKGEQNHEGKYVNMAQCAQRVESRLLAKERFLADIPVEDYVAVLCKLFTEVRKKDGEEYQPHDLAVIYASLDCSGAKAGGKCTFY